MEPYRGLSELSCTFIGLLELEHIFEGLMYLKPLMEDLLCPFASLDNFEVFSTKTPLGVLREFLL